MSRGQEKAYTWNKIDFLKPYTQIYNLGKIHRSEKGAQDQVLGHANIYKLGRGQELAQDG